MYIFTVLKGCQKKPSIFDLRHPKMGGYETVKEIKFDILESQEVDLMQNQEQKKRKRKLDDYDYEDDFIEPFEGEDELVDIECKLENFFVHKGEMKQSSKRIISTYRNKIKRKEQKTVEKPKEQAPEPKTTFVASVNDDLKVQIEAAVGFSLDKEDEKLKPKSRRKKKEKATTTTADEKENPTETSLLKENPADVNKNFKLQDVLSKEKNNKKTMRFNDKINSLKGLLISKHPKLQRIFKGASMVRPQPQYEIANNYKEQAHPRSEEHIDRSKYPPMNHGNGLHPNDYSTFYYQPKYPYETMGDFVFTREGKKLQGEAVLDSPQNLKIKKQKNLSRPIVEPVFNLTPPIKEINKTAVKKTLNNVATEVIPNTEKQVQQVYLHKPQDDAVVDLISPQEKKAQQNLLNIFGASSPQSVSKTRKDLPVIEPIKTAEINLNQNNKGTPLENSLPPQHVMHLKTKPPVLKPNVPTKKDKDEEPMGNTIIKIKSIKRPEPKEPVPEINSDKRQESICVLEEIGSTSPVKSEDLRSHDKWPTLSKRDVFRYYLKYKLKTLEKKLNNKVTQMFFYYFNLIACGDVEEDYILNFSLLVEYSTPKRSEESGDYYYHAENLFEPEELENFGMVVDKHLNEITKRILNVANDQKMFCENQKIFIGLKNNTFMCNCIIFFYLYCCKQMKAGSDFALAFDGAKNTILSFFPGGQLNSGFLRKFNTTLKHLIKDGKFNV